MKRKRTIRQLNTILTTGIVTFFTSALFIIIHIPLKAFDWIDWMRSWIFAWMLAIAILKLVANKIRKITLYVK